VQNLIRGLSIHRVVKRTKQLFRFSVQEMALLGGRIGPGPSPARLVILLGDLSQKILEGSVWDAMR